MSGARSMSLLDKWRLAIEMAADPDITLGELKAALYLLDNMDERGIAQRGHSAIADHICLARRNAIRATEALCAKRYFQVVKQGGGTRSTSYRLTDPVRLETDRTSAKMFACPDSCDIGMEKARVVTPASLVGSDASVTGVVTPASPGGDAHVTGAVTPASHNPSSLPLHLPKRPSKRPAVDATGFDELWAIWPKKQKEKEARAAYVQALKLVDHGTLMDAARRQAAIDARREAQYRTNLGKWLIGERWKDEAALHANGNASDERDIAASIAEARLLKAGGVAL